MLRAKQLSKKKTRIEKLVKKQLQRLHKKAKKDAKIAEKKAPKDKKVQKKTLSSKPAPKKVEKSKPTVLGLGLGLGFELAGRKRDASRARVPKGRNQGRKSLRK